MSVLMQAPAGVSPSSTFKSPLTGTSYTVDAYGFVLVSALVDLVWLDDGGFQAVISRNNLTATTDPGTGSDNTQDFYPGGLWINTLASNNSGTQPRAWICISSATGAAVWQQISVGNTTAGTAEFTNLIVDALLTGGIAALTAFSAGGQAGATPITTLVSNVTTASSSSSPYASVTLPAATQGRFVLHKNSAANPHQVFGLEPSTTINSFAAATGFTHPQGAFLIYVCDAANHWSVFNFGMGFAAFAAYNTNSATSSATLTGANISGGISEVTLALTGTLAADANATLPTVNNLVAAIPDPVAGQTYKLRVYNLSSGDFTWTLLTNTGWTLAGTMTIDAGGWRDFYVTLTTLSAATLTDIGGSAPVAGMGFATNFADRTNSATSSATLTGANITGGAIAVALNLTGTLGAGANATLPTVANLLAAIPDPVTGQSYRLRIINSSSANFAWTVLTNTGWTLSGTMTIAQNTWREFDVLITSVGSVTATLTSVGTGTYS